MFGKRGYGYGMHQQQNQGMLMLLGLLALVAGAVSVMMHLGYISQDSFPPDLLQWATAILSGLAGISILYTQSMQGRHMMY
ncbi:MAG: hypothetical protein ABIH41_01190 [Nanoarchaeota archaeon]